MKHGKKSHKKTNIIVVAFIIACIAFALLLAGSNSAALQFSATMTPSPTQNVTPMPSPTASPKGTPILIETPATPSPTPTLAPTPVPTPVPTPYVHPGIRDNKFTIEETIIDERSYRSPHLSIEIERVERGESVMYVADVYFASLDNFRPVFANEGFHKGYQTTSTMAQEGNAIFAVNSDSATAVDYGIIVRDCIEYRNVAAADHLAIFADGSMQTYNPTKITAHSLITKGAVHVFCFGPALLYEGSVIDDFSYSHIRRRHPRTAIGMVEPYHYVFVVVDGRSKHSKGMTLEELSKVMYDLGCTVAYNLDGGGSSTMVFMDELVNRPEGGTNEREIDSAILVVDPQG